MNPPSSETLTAEPLERRAKLPSRLSKVRRYLEDPTAQRWSVTLVVVIALVVRLADASFHNRWQPDDNSWLRGDEPGYDGLARGILRWFRYDWPGRVPLYPLWVAGVHWVTETSYHELRYIQAFLGAGTVLLTYLFARRVFGHTAGLVVALCAALSTVLIHQSIHVLSEVLFTPVVLVAMLALWRAVQRPEGRRFAWAGFWIGVSDLVRPTLLFFPVFLFVPLTLALGRRAGLRYGAVLTLAALAVITPWLVRNRIHHGAWFPLATSNGIVWQASPEYYRLLREQGYTYRRVWSEILYGPGWQKRSPTSIEGDRYWTARGLRSIAGDPTTYFRYAVEKVATYWVGDPNADWHNERVFSFQALRRAGLGRSSAVGLMFARALPIVALFSIFALWRQRRRLLPIYALLAYCTLLHAALHAEARLSEPLQPFLLVLVVGAVFWQRMELAARRGAPTPALPVRRFQLSFRTARFFPTKSGALARGRGAPAGPRRGHPVPAGTSASKPPPSATCAKALDAGPGSDPSLNL